MVAETIFSKMEAKKSPDKVEAIFQCEVYVTII